MKSESRKGANVFLGSFLDKNSWCLKMEIETESDQDIFEMKPHRFDVFINIKYFPVEKFKKTFASKM